MKSNVFVLQAVVYHVASHPEVPEFRQCVTFNYFLSEASERSYAIFGVLAMYVIPLSIILIVNSIILYHLKNSVHLQTPRMKRSFTSSLLTDIIQSDQVKLVSSSPCQITYRAGYFRVFPVLFKGFTSQKSFLQIVRTHRENITVSTITQTKQFVPFATSLGLSTYVKRRFRRTMAVFACCIVASFYE